MDSMELVSVGEARRLLRDAGFRVSENKFAKLIANGHLIVHQHPLDARKKLLSKTQVLELLTPKPVGVKE
jgi:hypothetical protein